MIKFRKKNYFFPLNKSFGCKAIKHQEFYFDFRLTLQPVLPGIEWFTDVSDNSILCTVGNVQLSILPGSCCRSVLNRDYKICTPFMIVYRLHS